MNKECNSHCSAFWVTCPCQKSMSGLCFANCWRKTTLTVLLFELSALVKIHVRAISPEPYRISSWHFTGDVSWTRKTTLAVQLFELFLLVILGFSEHQDKPSRTVINRNYCRYFTCERLTRWTIVKILYVGHFHLNRLQCHLAFSHLCLSGSDSLVSVSLINISASCPSQIFIDKMSCNNHFSGIYQSYQTFVNSLSADNKEFIEWLQSGLRERINLQILQIYIMACGMEYLRLPWGSFLFMT